ncbi:hypothetical protein [Nostoc sp. LEGE 12450]|uniref:hypothetical protein n=1 Tax=Nostoc sp. LEGE 12450 TaxID=1828643 RepID=UPI00187FBA33|nr:hypothetical protein [Nostoc sp. LEGE 12450]MBE8989194.1 hypothetical protein [Nostoc sp. LEGE 12450]
MNAATIINYTLAKYKSNPIDEYYLTIEDAMQRYQANPPDEVSINMKDTNYISKHENLRIYKTYPFEKDRAITLEDLLYKFFRCPNNITSENMKQALKKYKDESVSTPNIIETFDI